MAKEWKYGLYQTIDSEVEMKVVIRKYAFVKCRIDA